MRDYVIMTDSCSDLPPSLIAEYGIYVLPLTLSMGGKNYSNLPDGSDIGFSEFYNRLRQGEESTTSAISVGAFSEAMRDILRHGKNILCLCFSSALSATYQSACIAAAEVQGEFPAQEIFVLDTLCASLGQGHLVYRCALKKRAGLSLKELAAWAEGERLRTVHWFTVDDLYHLKRGGRVSAATALVGTMLSIKPVLHVDNEGRLINVAKARGRRASLLALVEKMEQTAVDPAENPVFISHGDCLEDAEFVAEEVRRRFGTKDIQINYVGPVIGSHSGPGTLALFFVGTER